MTNTNVKFIAIMDFGDMKEADLRKVQAFLTASSYAALIISTAKPSVTRFTLPTLP